MPLYRALGNVWHSDVYVAKGDVAELPEGEKSELLVLVDAPKPAPKAVVVDDEPVSKPEHKSNRSKRD